VILRADDLCLLLGLDGVGSMRWCGMENGANSYTSGMGSEGVQGMRRLCPILRRSFRSGEKGRCSRIMQAFDCRPFATDGGPARRPLDDSMNGWLRA
jgi:hypothetical protein